MSNPSLDDIKLVLEFSMSYAKKKIYSFQAIQEKYKYCDEERQAYNSVTRRQNMTEYMNLISNGM